NARNPQDIAVRLESFGFAGHARAAGDDEAQERFERVQAPLPALEEGGILGRVLDHFDVVAQSSERGAERSAPEILGFEQALCRNAEELLDGRDPVLLAVA